MSRRTIPFLLTYTGAIPFMACAILLFLKIQTLPLLGSVETIMAVYGLVIATFLSGIHWGQHLGRDDKWLMILPIVSNMNTILLWIGYLTLSFQYFIALLIISFLTSLLVDKRLARANLIQADYMRVRAIITAIVIMSLISSLLL